MEMILSDQQCTGSINQRLVVRLSFILLSKSWVLVIPYRNCRHYVQGRVAHLD